MKICADENGTPVFQPNSLKKGDEAEEAIKTLKSIQPDFIVVVAYGKT